MTDAPTAVTKVAQDLTAILDLADLDYDPLAESWICGAHGVAECWQGDCPALPWPESNSNALLGAFIDWADAKFREAVRPYDESEDPEKQLPEAAMRAYSPSEWLVERLLGEEPE